MNQKNNNGRAVRPNGAQQSARPAQNISRSAAAGTGMGAAGGRTSSVQRSTSAQRSTPVQRSASAQRSTQAQQRSTAQNTQRTSAQTRNTVRRKKKTRRDNQKKLGVILAAVLSALIFIALCLGLFFILYKPSVDDNHGTSETENPAIEGIEDFNEFAPPETVQQIGEDGNPIETKRKKETYNFLVIGRDKVGLNTDVIMIINFNTGSGEIAVMQIPRDTYIEIGKSSCKINSVYSIMHSRAASNGISDSEDRGMRDMAAVLEANLGIEIDYYALLNLTGFGNIVDIVGGIPFDVPYNMDYDDPFQDLHIHIKAGPQVLNGELAQQFIRFRDGFITGDIGRIDAQKLFMTACIDHLKESLNASTIISLINEIYVNLKTSLSIADVSYFIKQFFLTDNAKISFINFPGEDTYVGGVSYYVMKRADMLALVNRYFNVYTTDINDALFDPYLIFTRENAADVMMIYEAKPLPNLSAYVKSADNISDNGLYIPLK